jgi:SAM-dependent methyltransferase
MQAVNIPMPPLELRQTAWPGDPAAFDNAGSQPIYAGYGLSPDAYESVFDFGCGCGRQARQLLQQNPRPRRYGRIDVHRGMIDWCQRNLTPIDSNFQFLHHDVYAPGYAADNSLQLAQPFPVHDATFSLVIAHSVFTHLFRRQTEYYLPEIARILSRKVSRSRAGSSSTETAFRSCSKVHSVCSRAKPRRPKR